MRGRWLCCVSAAVLALIPGANSAVAQEVQAAEALLAIIGKSPVVVHAIEAELGTAAAGALLGKSAAEVGKFAVSNNDIAAKIAGSLSATDRLEWAGAVNTLRLSEVNSLAMSGIHTQPQSAINGGAGATSLFTYREGLINTEPSPAVSEDVQRWIQSSQDVNRTISITPLGDINLSPKLEVPLMTFGKTRLQVEVESIPAGKFAAAAGTTAAAAACGQQCIDEMRQRWKKLLGEAPDIRQ